MTRSSLLISTIKTKCAVIVAVGVCLSGCAVATQDAALPLEVPRAFSASGSQEVGERWWTAFNDPGLNRMIDTALSANFNLETAWQRLREARAILDRESAARFPALDGQMQGELVRSDAEDSEQLRLGAAAEYELDLWGRIDSSVAAERYRLKASLLDYRTAALSLSAEVARTWFQWLEAWAQWTLINDQVEANEKVLRLIKARFGSGVVRSVDILRQQQLLEATREQRLAVEARIQVLEHLLVTLSGQAPQSGVLPEAAALPELPPLPATGVPLVLIQRRPDVQREFNLLRAADRDLAAAISNRYPRVTLSAAVATAEDDVQDLFDNWIATLGANLLAPIIDGGQRRAEVRRNEARKSRFLYRYAQTALDALREVEDALSQEQKQAARIESLGEQVRLARLSYRQLRNEYFNGLANYVDVLVALVAHQRISRELLTAQRNLLEFRVSLYRALAGGIRTERESGHGPAS